jgi:hypothetical protein
VVPLRSIEAHLGDRKLQDGGENWEAKGLVF